MDADHRARGLLQFYGALTGRWSGRRFMPHNLKRPDLEPDEVLAAIRLLRTGDYAVVRMIYDDLLRVIGDCLRGMIAARRGRRIVAADFSNIEGRVLAWLAGEQWKLDAFVEADAGRAPDLYIQSYCRTFGVPFFPKTDPRRKFGKTMELASGFGGGHGAYMRFGMTGAVVEKLAALVRSITPDDKWEAADGKYRPGFDLKRDQWTALRLTIDGWRDAHPAIRQLWQDLEEAAINATESPGKTFRAGRLAFKKSGSFLFMRLPSGRFLSYPYPQVMRLPTPWKNDKGEPVYRDMLTHFAMINVSNARRKVDRKAPGPWARISTYGGCLAENATQATARDILADAMPRLEAAGYPIVLTVHDEAVAEVPNGHGSLDEMISIMGENPVWADGLPIAVAGFEAERYGK
jgi:DNA polymerase